LPDTWQGHEDALEKELVNVVHSNEIKPIDNKPQFVHNGKATILSYHPDYAEISVFNPDEGFLFLNDAYYRGWRATVNGEETPIYRANVMFRAVRVPAGESTVVFEFVPTLWYGAMAFGAVMWLLAIIVGVVLWRFAVHTRENSTA
jgi:uncharacterized membrane protein YfhO